MIKLIRYILDVGNFIIVNFQVGNVPKVIFSCQLLHDLQGKDDNLKHLHQAGEVVGKVKICKYFMTHRYTEETMVWGATSNPIDWL